MLTEAQRSDPELTPRLELPLYGAVYVCIGASRPDKSIGGPTAVALAQAGADVFITGGDPDPNKQKRPERVLQEIEQTGSTRSGRGTFDVATEEGRVALVAEVKAKYGQVDGILYFPSGGLHGDNRERQQAHGEALNIEAPVNLAQAFLAMGLIKPGGYFQMMPSVYSWGYPNITSPDERYDEIVAPTKHEGELEMHSLIPEFEKAGVTLTYLAAHGVDKTFAMNFMQMKAKKEDPRIGEQILETADVGGEKRLPTIPETTQGSVHIATLARHGQLRQGHVEYVGIAEQARIPLEVVQLDKDETASRLSLLYDTEAQMVDTVQVYGNGRRAIGTFVAEGERVRPILAQAPYAVNLVSGGLYTVDHKDTSGHFNIVVEDSRDKLEIFPGIRQLAFARVCVEQIARQREPLKPVRITGITDVAFEKPVGPEMEIEAQAVYTTGSDEVAIHEVREDGKTVSTLTLKIADQVDEDGGDTRIIDPEYFIEAAAQTALLAAQTGRHDEQPMVPLFGAIERVDFLQGIPKGEQITIDVRLRSSNGFVADATVYKADGTVAQEIRGMSGPVRDKDFMVRFIQKQLKLSNA